MTSPAAQKLVCLLAFHLSWRAVTQSPRLSGCWITSLHTTMQLITDDRTHAICQGLLASRCVCGTSVYCRDACQTVTHRHIHLISVNGLLSCHLSLYPYFYKVSFLERSQFYFIKYTKYCLVAEKSLQNKVKGTKACFLSWILLGNKEN